MYMYTYIWYVFTYVPDTHTHIYIYIHMMAVYLQIELDSKIFWNRQISSNIRFFPTSLCGVLVFGCALPPAFRRPAPALPPANLLTHTTCPHTTCPHTTYSHTTCPHTHLLTHNLPTHNLLTLTHNLPTHNLLTHNLSTQSLSTHNLSTHNFLTHNFLTHNFLTHNLLTHNLFSPPTYSHTQLVHTKLVHTQLVHTTYSHTTCPHTNLLTHTQLAHTQLAHTQLTHPQLVHAQLTHTQLVHTLVHTQLVHTQLVHTQLPHTQLPHTQLTHTNSLSTHSLLTHNLSTHNLLTHTTCPHAHSHTPYSHTPYSHTTCPHKACPHTAYSHTTCPHTTCSQLVTRGRRGTWWHGSSLCVAGVALMALGWLWWRAWFPVDAVVAAAVGVAGVALGDTDLHFAWQAWHLVTWIVTLRGRRGTWRHRPSLCVAGVALGDMDVQFAWQVWHLWHWAGSGGALGSSWRRCATVAAAVGVALDDIDLHFAWQAWHLVTWMCTLRGRRGTGPVPSWRRCRRGCSHGRRGTWRHGLHFAWHGTWRHRPSLCVAGMALGDMDRHFAWQARYLWHWAGSGGALVPSWRRCRHCRCGCWRGRRRTWRHRPSVCAAGVALGDIDLHFAWQAWHLVTWIVASVALMTLGWLWCLVPSWRRCRRGCWRGRRGTWRHGPSLCVAGVGLGDMDHHFAWQAWHLATSTFTLRGRRGTWWHGRALCVAGVALMALGWLWWRAWFPVDAVVAAAVGEAGVALGDIDLHFAWQAWHLATWTCTLRGRRGTYGTGMALVARLVPSWRRCRRRCWRGRPLLCMAGMALGDIDLHFAWQAWHLWHWAGSGGALVSQLSPRLLAWQAWHLACIHTYMHACMHTCIHAYMHTCMHTYHLCHTSSFTYKFAPHNCFYFSILHHILCLSFLPCPATTFVAPYWKKLTCGVIRSFIFEPFLPNSVSLFWGMGSTLDTPKMVLFSRPNLLRGETCSLASWDMDLSEHGGYYKMAMGTVNMMIHHWIIFSLNFQTKPLQITSFPNGQHHAFFRRKVDLWSFVPHYPSPPPGRRYALGLQQGYINPLMQFLLIVHTTHANSGWECSTLFGFGGDDDFYILCIGIHINQAVKEDEVFGNCSNLCGSWNKYERVHNPSTENQGKPHGFLWGSDGNSTEQHVASNSCQLPIYRVILWYNNPYHFLTAWVEASISTGRIAEGWNWER